MTPDDVKALLDYDPLTGDFRWKVRRGQASVGKIAGTPHNQGYIQIKAGEKIVLAHRLAWFVTYGKFPSCDIDHINGDKRDNRIANLRLATRSENMANTTLPRSNTSGFKGVWYFKRTGRWMAGFRKDGKSIHLGYFDTAEEAAEAHRIAYAKAFGEYARAA